MLTIDEQRRREGVSLYTTTLGADIRQDIAVREKEANDVIQRVTGKIDKYLRSTNPSTAKKGSEVIERWLDTGALALMSEHFKTEAIAEEDREDNAIIAKMMGILSVIDDTFVDDMTTLALGDAIFRSVKNLTEYEAEAAESAAMKDVSVYLDTSLIYRILGCYGLANIRASEELLEICKLTQCKLRLFEHTFEESREGILAVARRLQGGAGEAYGPIVRFALEEGKDASDLIQAAAQLRQEIEARGIQVVERPPYLELLGIDEIKLDKALETEVRQERETARRRDIDSITSIYRLREGNGVHYLEKCRAILITGNRSLASSSAKFFSRVFKEEGRNNSVQLCMTDVIFCTRLWTKLPTKNVQTPRLQILSHAIGNLIPRDHIVSKFQRFVSEMVERDVLTKQQALIIEYSDFVRMSLAMNFGAGDDLSFSEAKSILVQSIDEMRLQIDKKAHAKAEEQLLKAKNDLDKVAQSVQTYQDVSDPELDILRKDVENLARDLDRRQIEIARLNRLADVLAGIVVFLVIGAVLFGALSLALRDIGSEEISGISLNGKTSAFLRFLANSVLTIATIIGINYVGLFKPIKEIIKRVLLGVFE